MGPLEIGVDPEHRSEDDIKLRNGLKMVKCAGSGLAYAVPPYGDLTHVQRSDGMVGGQPSRVRLIRRLINDFSRMKPAP